MPSRVPLLFGWANLGFPGATNVRISDPTEAQKCLDLFSAHGYNEYDTARVYTEGTSEKFIAQLDLKNGVVDTKVSSNVPGSHKSEAIRKSVQESLNIFKPHGIKIRVLYLHLPDRSVPFEETVQEMDRLHKAGVYERFGLSNYAAWEVTEIYMLCKERGYVLPTVYTGSYNLLARGSEPELIPCLRKFNIRMVAWNPLAGGFLTGKFREQADMAQVEKGGRFDTETHVGPIFTRMYVKESNFKAIKLLQDAADKAGLTLVEVALRWLQHHSALLPTDGVILGASQVQHLEANISASEEGPLPDSILLVIEEAKDIVAATAPKYWV